MQRDHGKSPRYPPKTRDRILFTRTTPAPTCLGHIWRPAFRVFGAYLVIILYLYMCIKVTVELFFLARTLERLQVNVDEKNQVKEPWQVRVAKKGCARWLVGLFQVGPHPNQEKWAVSCWLPLPTKQKGYPQNKTDLCVGWVESGACVAVALSIEPSCFC